MTPEQPPRGFAPADYATRTSKLQSKMAKHGWDGMLLTTAADIYYICGFLTPFFISPTRPWFVLIPAKGKPVAVVPSIGAAAMAKCYIGEVRQWHSPKPDDEGITLLAETLGDLPRANSNNSKGKTKTIAVPQGAETFIRMPQADYDKLRALLHPIVFVDSGEVLWQLRMQKSAAEINKIRYAAAVMSDAFAALPLAIENSRMSERAICRILSADVITRGADDVPYLVAGGGYETIIMPPTYRVANSGEILMIDAGAVYDGYFCDFCRNYAAEKLPAAIAKAHDVLYAALQTGFAAARPGNTAADIWQAINKVLIAGGFANENSGGRFGHGIGLQLTEKPSITPDDKTILQTGMTLALEPSLTMADGMLMVREENIAIGEPQNEWLTTPAPPQMFNLR